MAPGTNRLAEASSPYLRQHADNPVDWHPWGDEAFRVARERDVPVLVSVGYAACHWCHVMAHESFEDPEIAALMNEGFVNVKVDREERPDVDAVYMAAVQALTGSGGWPMTVVVTPDGEPWFAGTYFPPDDRYGRPSFRRVLEALVRTWRERRDEVAASARSITEHVGQLARGLGDGPAPGEATAHAALEALRAAEDVRHGGFGGAPKFPPHTALRWCLEDAPDDGRTPSAADMALRCLRGMADGGVYDQLAGGFARYAVDASWTVPHFEKMLYDNALLLPTLARAARRHDDARLLEVARRTLSWLLTELALGDGTFASALDADSEGEEGRFYTWTPAELRAALGDPADAELALALYGVTEAGQLEGRSVLVWRGFDDPDVRGALGDDAVSDERARERAERVRRALLAARAARVRPLRDDKVVTSWNALAIRGLAEAAADLGGDDGRRATDAAVHAADAIWERAWDGDGLRHLAPPGGDPDAVALLEDAAAFGLACLALHRAAGDERHLRRALTLADRIVRDFADDADGGFFTTRHQDPALVVRGKGVLDGPTPSETGSAAELLGAVAAWTEDPRLLERAERALAGADALARRHPTAAASMLSAHARIRAAPLQVVVAGDAGDAGAEALLELARREAPRRASVARRPADAALLERIPVFVGKETRGGRAVAYACEAGVCHAPTSDAEELARQLAAWEGERPT